MCGDSDGGIVMAIAKPPLPVELLGCDRRPGRKPWQIWVKS